ncbi:hypothetical protein FNV43_RR15799 [Rhamnella rubrinervis]|uniref:Exostosin GT47 domain-containing protein n=1 Tax=Rhamnella rubrinervis TaxID=2594499 RepID=A0A8K0E9K3_9ROSA|nr:hypothetical protein FNV43_RR15799 [Rhamnella rubrinervis]
MEYPFHFRKLRYKRAQKWLFVVGVVAATHLLFQSFLLPYGNALRSLLPGQDVPTHVINNFPSSSKSAIVRNPLTVNASDLIDPDMIVWLEEGADKFEVGDIGLDAGIKGNGRFEEINFALEEEGLHNTFGHAVDTDVINNSPTKEVVGMKGSLASVSVKNQDNGSIQGFAHKDNQEQTVKPNVKASFGNILEVNLSQTAKKSDGGFDSPFQPPPLLSSPAASNNATLLRTLTSGENVSFVSASQQNDLLNSENRSALMTIRGRKKMRSEMPPKSRTSIHEMNHILMKHTRSMKPRRSSVRDREIVAVKKEIKHAPSTINDPELFAPLFRNISMFKRSYELMERTLKVYVYKDGVKPIFHQPILKGLYASEGWFMKLMEGNKHYVVKDPRRAHLFYMPFSTRMLEYTLYVRNSHNRTNLRQYLKDYSEKLAAKYPYWNRTDGADHFLVACHDWAPYETRHHMERCIKALCNADVTAGFKIGRDVSLPETYVRSARNPLRDLGGKPPSQRRILAFYAGNMHGYVRPILLKYWKDKDPDMKIFGPMPPGVASKMNYIQHMKSSKYCICPKGYEVNSPRVVEAIFYECVPVIISDNFVPPFFEVLNWDAFSIIIAEEDIPRLKDILLSIPQERYLEMQLAVRKVQKHFLWHARPIKYDLFHMTLHSIWYSRVLQTKLR